MHKEADNCRRACAADLARNIVNADIGCSRLRRRQIDCKRSFRKSGCRFPLRIDPVFPSRIDPGDGMSRRAGFGSSW